MGNRKGEAGLYLLLFAFLASLLTQNPSKNSKSNENQSLARTSTSTPSQEIALNEPVHSGQKVENRTPSKKTTYNREALKPAKKPSPKPESISVNSMKPQRLPAHAVPEDVRDMPLNRSIIRTKDHCSIGHIFWKEKTKDGEVIVNVCPVTTRGRRGSTVGYRDDGSKCGYLSASKLKGATPPGLYDLAVLPVNKNRPKWMGVKTLHMKQIKGHKYARTSSDLVIHPRGTAGSGFKTDAPLRDSGSWGCVRPPKACVERLTAWTAKHKKPQLLVKMISKEGRGLQKINAAVKPLSHKLSGKVVKTKPPKLKSKKYHGYAVTVPTEELHTKGWKKDYSRFIEYMMSTQFPNVAYDVTSSDGFQRFCPNFKKTWTSSEKKKVFVAFMKSLSKVESDWQPLSEHPEDGIEKEFGEDLNAIKLRNSNQSIDFYQGYLNVKKKKKVKSSFKMRQQVSEGLFQVSVKEQKYYNCSEFNYLADKKYSRPSGKFKAYATGGSRGSFVGNKVKSTLNPYNNISCAIKIMQKLALRDSGKFLFGNQTYWSPLRPGNERLGRRVVSQMAVEYPRCKK